MGKSSRDDFPPRTKQKLWARVSGRCSNPDCRVQTQGPASNEDGTVNIGKAAHITAAAPGGPRYDSSLTPEQRKGFKNGIWLCAIHADLVDKDTTGHKLDLLYGWKQRAEQAAKRELGQRLPSDDDAIRTLGAAFTGNATSFIPSAVRNVHAAMSQTLHELDPRFSVESSYANGTTRFDIRAQKPVELSIAFDIQNAPDIPSKITDLLASGKHFETDACAVTIRGSPLFDRISAETFAGKFAILASRRPVRQKIWIQYPERAERHQFDDIDGYVSSGTESIRMEACGWGGLFTLSMTLSRACAPVEAQMHVSVNLRPWQGCDLRQLRFFNTLATLVEHLSAGANLHLSLEVEGSAILTSNPIDCSQHEWVTNLGVLLEYTRLARSLVSVLGFHVKFDAERDITRESYRALVEMERIAVGNYRVPKEKITSNPSTTILVNDDGANLLGQASGSQVVQIRSQQTPPIDMFGQTLNFPSRVTTIGPVQIRLSPNIEKMQTGDKVDVEFVMQDGFELAIEFDKVE